MFGWGLFLFTYFTYICSPQVADKNLLKMSKNEKYVEYAIKLNEAVASVFQEDSDYRIKQSDFEDDDNLKAFIHALATVVPNRIFNKLTGDEKNILEFNHIANMLIFEYAQLEKENP